MSTWKQKAARKLQKRTGEKYTKALRAVEEQIGDLDDGERSGNDIRLELNKQIEAGDLDG